jgi:glyoxylase-like metal-dependent hydrolase (beta-lactamase superfamily II)
VVFDAPPSFGERLRAAIEMSAPGVPITHFVLSHKHADHNGGGYTFADIEGLTVIGAGPAPKASPRPRCAACLTPTETFEETLSLTVGGVPIELRTANFHANDVDVIIHLPEHQLSHGRRYDHARARRRS